MTRLIILPVIFSAATFALWILLYSAPGWQKDNTDQPISAWSLPKHFDNFTAIADQFKIYQQHHFNYITTVFVAAYLYKQTFAIPGSFFLNVIAGALFGLYAGFVLVCLLTTLGATLCYLFSELFGREYVLYYFGQRLTYLQQKLDDNSNRLLPFLLFARMFPISPSWLLNIVAPFLNIPLPIFALSALVGLAPYNFVCVQAGYILSDLRSWDDIFDTWTMLKLTSFALIPLAYAIFVRPRSIELSTGAFDSQRKTEVV
uniref:Transmembrane protein 41A n=1 Tax=Plectus sambesii TaxID=2011161 RepID=A0A914VGN0_9BILA